MKAVIATGIFPPDVGGPATFVPTLASDWTRQGWTVEVVTYSDAPKGPAYPYAVRRAWRFHSALPRYASYLRHVWKAAEGASVVFAQDPVAAGLPACFVAWLRRKRFILKIVGDFAWEHARVQEGYEKSLEDFQHEQFLSLRIRLMRTLERFIARRADAVIVPSQYLAGIAKTWGVPEKKISVIYNGVEPVRVTAGEKQRHRIVTAGRLVPWKGMDTLIAALTDVRKRVPDATLTIIGDGPYGDRLRALVRERNLEDAVTFTGRLTREELSRHIVESAVFALISSYEGFSHQLVEAFQLGAAVVASDAGGNPEIVTDGENGLLVKHGDAAATAMALLRFLEDPAFAAKCGAAAKHRAGDFTTELQMLRTTRAVAGAGPRVLLLSRDASANDPASVTGKRLRGYAERVTRLDILPLVKGGFGGIPALFIFGLKALRLAGSAEANLIVAQDPFETGIVAHLIAFIRRIPYVIEDHAAFFDGDAWKNESRVNLLKWFIGRHVISHASGIRTVSERGRRAYTALGIGPVVVVPVSMTLPVSPPPAHVGPFTALYAGRFAIEKDFATLLSAFKLLHDGHPEAQLRLIGAGPEEAHIRELVSAKDLGAAVTLEPWQTSLTPAFAQADVAVLASRREGFGRFAAEAIAYGLPVVMTDVGLAGELIRDGIEGFVVPVGDAGAFASALKKCVDDVTLRPRMRETAIRRASTIPTPEAVAEQVTSFWKSIVNGN